MSATVGSALVAENHGSMPLFEKATHAAFRLRRGAALRLDSRAHQAFALMTKIPNSSKQWQKLVQKTPTIAEQTEDPGSRHILLAIAAAYELSRKSVVKKTKPR
jgi:hypothetical protein